MLPLGAGNREPGLGIPVMGRAIRDAAPPPAATAPEFEVLTVFVGGRSPLWNRMLVDGGRTPVELPDELWKLKKKKLNMRFYFIIRAYF